MNFGNIANAFITLTRANVTIITQYVSNDDGNDDDIDNNDDDDDDDNDIHLAQRSRFLAILHVFLAFLTSGICRGLNYNFQGGGIVQLFGPPSSFLGPRSFLCFNSELSNYQ